MGNSSYITARAHPHQLAFADEFFSKETNQNVLLQHHVGMGSSFAAMEVIRRHLEENPKGRVLVLGATLVLEQWARILVEIGIDADLIDLFRYRELLEQSPSERTLWKNRSVVLMRANYGHKEAVAASLAEDEWTLIVVDESHRFMNRGKNILNTVYRSSPNARVLLLSPLYVNASNFETLEPLTVVRWDWGKIASTMGTDGHHRPTLDLQFVDYKLSENELRLRERTSELHRLAGRLPSAGYLSARLLLNSLSSSPAAYEETLLRYRNKLVPYYSTLNVEGLRRESVQSSVADEDQVEWLREITTCLEELESLPTDPKLDILVSLIRSIRSDRFSRSALLLTEFKSTLYYVQARLEEEGIEAVSIHGGLQNDLKNSLLTEARDSSLVLLGTSSILTQGYNLSFLDEAVFYDPPRNEVMLHRLLNQLGVARRTRVLHLNVLMENTNSMGHSRTGRQIEKVANEWGFNLSARHSDDIGLNP